MFIMSAIRISLIGDKKTGKSTFINFINKNVYSPNLSPSIGVDYFSLLVSPNLNWKIWDLSGDNNLSHVTNCYYKDKDLFLLFFDVNNPDTFNNLNYWIKRIMINNKQYKIILIGNKIDLNKNVSDIEINTLCNSYNMKYVEISIKNNTNIQELTNMINNSPKSPVNNNYQKRFYNSSNQYIRLEDDKQVKKCCVIL